MNIEPKKIAEIIKKWSKYSPCYSPKSICKDISKDLSDLFEREWEKVKKENFEGVDIKADMRYFNRSQFLKLCGVKE